MRLYLLILLMAIVYAGELEVEGDLKVTGNIDAQNNPIKNVGVPSDMNDAINAQILQDALREDGPFEYKMYISRIYFSQVTNGMGWYEYIEDIGADNSWNGDFHSELFSSLNSGYKIDQIIPLGDEIDNYFKQIWILKRPIEE